METILNELNNEKIWNNFLKYKIENNLLTNSEEKHIKEYILNKKYENIANSIINGTYIFSYPVKHCINKIGKNKKRIIYTFNEDEMMILKLLSFLLLERYNPKFSKNCYSFRKHYSVKNAIHNILNSSNINNMYGYKIDIHNYFNSVNVNKLLEILKNFLTYENDKGITVCDNKLLVFFEKILNNNKVLYNGKVIEENKGIMAGIPISSFLANVYLTDMDYFFQEKEDIIYARYSDDIILFCSPNDFEKNVKILEEIVIKKDLILNDSKKEIILPGESWSFLGFKYIDGNIDISDIALKKVKGKIKRSARKLRRWMLRKSATNDRAIRAVIRKFNIKFFDNCNSTKELTWSRWYFPIITTTASLNEIDKYMQQYLRYISTGKHNKKNYEKISYNTLKKYGYRPLVSEYWKYRKKEIIND